MTIMASYATSRTVRASVQRQSVHRPGPITVTGSGITVEGLNARQARAAARMLARRNA
jgi:hypothetical protein